MKRKMAEKKHPRWNTTTCQQKKANQSAQVRTATHTCKMYMTGTHPNPNHYPSKLPLLRSRRGGYPLRR